ncbi:CheR family methyltransferase [Legionella sp. MW5194]|uniref:CheR family methyltransferase n=1 Tax=Legionella sp. MW5194 TaxID=2662448 RepID=UPI002101F795|nr:CheR family methyltransferase [Legionella sp. MW5194]
MQTAASARYDGMPKSAINTGVVDYILLPEKIYPFLLDYIAHFNDKSIVLADSVAKEIHQILVLLNNQTGHDFSLYKPNTIFRRIQKRLNILQIDDLSFYIKYLYQNPGELEILFRELLINVTNFFRDAEAFEVLKEIMIKKMRDDKPKDYGLRVWVPGCSTGEEAYSIAILLQECMDSLKQRFNVQIFGTDIDEDAIEIARAGVFPATISSEVSKERLMRFFVKEGESYKINIDIRKMIIFATQNLIKDPPFTKLDLLSCRNLLIYLTSQLQRRILPLFHYSLKPNGLLFLGTSETIGGAGDLFTILDRRWKIFERKGGVTSFQAVIDLPSSTPLSECSSMKATEKIMYENEPNLRLIIEQLLLKKHTPPCVVIDDQGSIVYVYGRTSRFLEFAAGEARFHFLEMVRPELKAKVSLAIRNATMQQKEIILSGLQFKEDGEIKHINLKVRPVFEAQVLHKKLLLIVFEEMAVFGQSHEKGRRLETKDELEKKITQLDQELKYTKESLQTTIEELETSNEELKSSNEELQSTNEELQSTNEEIETSKEELQSLNEELTTVNAELESRIEQLSSANDDIKNLLDNTEIATVFLDKDLCIKRFTPKATEIINLISSDVGRPISHIVSNLYYDTLIDDAREVLQTLEPIIREVIDKSEHWYVVRIIPYRTVTNVIDGVVITFLNIHAQKRAENNSVELQKELQKYNEINKVLLNNLTQAAVLVNFDDKIVFANKRFEQLVGLELKELLGRILYKLKLNWDANKLQQVLNDAQTSMESVHSNTVDMANNAMALMTYKYPENMMLICFSQT